MKSEMLISSKLRSIQKQKKTERSQASSERLCIRPVHLLENDLAMDAACKRKKLARKTHLLLSLPHHGCRVCGLSCNLRGWTPSLNFVQNWASAWCGWTPSKEKDLFHQNPQAESMMLSDWMESHLCLWTHGFRKAFRNSSRPSLAHCKARLIERLVDQN